MECSLVSYTVQPRAQTLPNPSLSSISDPALLQKGGQLRRFPHLTMASLQRFVEESLASSTSDVAGGGNADNSDPNADYSDPNADNSGRRSRGRGRAPGEEGKGVFESNSTGARNGADDGGGGFASPLPLPPPGVPSSVSRPGPRGALVFVVRGQGVGAGGGGGDAAGQPGNEKALEVRCA